MNNIVVKDGYHMDHQSGSNGMKTQNSKSRRGGSMKRAPRDDLYTASEAIAKLNLPATTFKRLVNEKKIPREVPFGKKEGYYPKQFIDVLSSHLQGKASYRLVIDLLEQIVSEKAKVRGATDWIRLDDLPFVQLLDIEVYGPEQTVDMSVTYRWWERNPYMCRILFNERDRRDIWGALTVMPLPEALIDRLLRQELLERDIRPDDIFVYEPGNVYDGYVASVIIRPQHQLHLRSLVQSVLDFWCQRYPEIQLRRLYAYSSSPEGGKLIRHLFFSRRYDLGPNAWELDPMDEINPSRLLASFRQCIQNKEA